MAVYIIVSMMHGPTNIKYIYIYCSDQQKITLENSKLKNSRFGWGASQYLPVHLNYHPIIINFVLQL